ncbi:hypothetical protein GNI_058110, partial [Gregarina niphandrodes]
RITKRETFFKGKLGLQKMIPAPRDLPPSYEASPSGGEPNKPTPEFFPSGGKNYGTF